MQDTQSTSVQVGLSVPDSFGIVGLSDHDILARCVSLGVRAVELDSRPIEAFLGAPAEPSFLHPPEASFETGLLPLEEEVLQEEFELGRRTFAAHVRAWRHSVSLSSLDALRRRYEDAEVRIEIIKWDDLALLQDDEVDYAFRVAKALGARVLSTELSPGGPTRLGPFADTHQMFVGFHGDETTAGADFEAGFGHGPFVGANVDIGNWVAGGYGSPLPFLLGHADRVTHVHLKDRRTSDGAVTWFGVGDAPIQDVLQAMRDNEWPFPAIIEIAYDLPSQTEQTAEIARALASARSFVGA